MAAILGRTPNPGREDVKSRALITAIAGLLILSAGGCANPDGNDWQRVVCDVELVSSQRKAQAYLKKQLVLCGGKVGALAKRVGMERTHLYRKLRSLGVDFGTGGD